MKNNILEYGINAGITLGGIYFLLGEKKYLNFVSLISILTIRYMGKEITVMLQKKDNAGGTTPYNPLKIPAKNMTPAHII